MIEWKIGDIHPEYGIVGAMGVREGEPYRMFVNKNNTVALIPLEVLKKEVECENEN